MAASPALRSGLILWLACLATAVVVPVLLDGPGPDALPVEALPLGRSGADTRALEDRIDALERQLAALELQRYEHAPQAQPLRPEGGGLASFLPTGDGSGLPDGWAERLARLEGFEAERQAAIAEAEAEELRERELARQLELAMVTQAHGVILDPNMPDREKTRAWTQLRRLDGQPWTDEVVLEMARIGESSEDDRAREEVWIGADSRHRNDLLVQPLLQALSSDRTANVREEAADALKRYLDMPGVREALLYASSHDASAEVRNEALEALMRGSR